MVDNETACFNAYPRTNESWCPTVYDGWLCWPSIPPGANQSQNCPKQSGTLDYEKAFRQCMSNGLWEKYHEIDKPNGHTHYEDCLTPHVITLFKMCDNFERFELGKKCKTIFRITRTLELVGLTFSLISLIISLLIFFNYRVLKNNRTKIHKNLFTATILQVVTRLIYYTNQEFTPDLSTIEKTPFLNEVVLTVLEYTKTAMFMWMFIEGLYLHNMITVTVFQEYTYIKLYIYAGWILPAIMTAIWVTTMVIVRSSWTFYYFLPYYWILEGPRSVIIVINLLFLINIIRILVQKLRESQIREREQVRKAVRAAIFLLPLMGISNICFWVDTEFDKSWKFATWMYVSYFLTTFQGFFVAILYCFLNGEVQTAIRNSWNLRIPTRNHEYAPCRNSTFVSTLPEADNPTGGAGPACAELKTPIILQAHRIFRVYRPKWIRNSFGSAEKNLQKNNTESFERNPVTSSLTMVDTNSCATNQIYPRLSSDVTDSITEDLNSESKV